MPEKPRFTRSQKVGMVFILGGSIVMGVSGGLQAGEKPVIGCALLTLGRLIVSAQCVWEDKLLSESYQHVTSARAVGWEGVCGLMLTLPLLFVGQWIPLRLTHSGKAADLQDVFWMVQHSLGLKLILPATVVTVSIYSWFTYVVLVLLASPALPDSDANTA